MAASAGLLLVARNRKVSAHRLHWLGLAYEIVICFVIAFVTYWQYYNDKKVLPSLTWVPAVVILFPLILPGPPRRMLAAARELGSYRLEGRLGQGGMGEVWRARHRMLARPAAIKLIRPSLGGNGRGGVPENVVRRFERKAQVIASLRSPHTVDLFNFGPLLQYFAI